MVTNVELARQSYDAFARDDLDEVLAALHPEIEWQQAQGLPHGGVYKGVDVVRRAIFAPLDEEWWDGFRADPEQFIDGGDEVVVLGRYSGHAKATGKPLAVPFVHVWTIRESQVVRFRQFLDTAGWNEALSA